MRWISNLIPTLVYTVPAVLIAISLHEFAHGWASWKLSDPPPGRPGGLPQPAAPPRPDRHPLPAGLPLRLGKAGDGRPALL
ncbi:MAG: hypothetical protein ACLVL7_13690 [Anaerotruncus massiliensis (ex Togo et al. 2019)]